MRRLLFLLAMLATTPALAQIEVASSVEAYHVVSAKIASSIPEGATFDGGWTADDGVSWLPHSSDTIHLTGTPGEHTLSFSGFWLHLKEISFKDGDGNLITIQSYLGHGSINETATFTVTGGTEPDPKPDPPKPIVGKKKIVCFIKGEQTERLPPAQAYIVNSLLARQHLRGRGHELAIIDDDAMANPPAEWAPWVTAAAGLELPVCCIAPIDGGPITCTPLPKDYKTLVTELLGETYP